MLKSLLQTIRGCKDAYFSQKYRRLRHFTILLFFVISIAGFGQPNADTSRVRLAGMVETSDTIRQKVAWVHVINLRTGQGTITDSLGLFHLNLRRTDTLLFRSIGFAENQYILPDSITSGMFFIHIHLSPVAYQLKVVDVIALSRRQQFRYDFLHLQLPETEWEKQIIIPGVTKGEYRTIRDEERIDLPDIGSPLTYLYSKFSKEVKSLKKLQELKNYEKTRAAIDAKYNKQQLMRFTGYNDSVVFLFIRFLNYSDDFLAATCEYDLYVDIASRMLDFEALYPLLFKPWAL